MIFTAFLTSGGSLPATVYVTILCGILSQVGHGTWTAILASVLFRESFQYRFRLNWKVIVSFLGVAHLHALWDGLPVLVAAFLSPELDMFLAHSLIGGMGFFVLWLRWGDARRLQIVQSIQPEPLIVNHEEPAEGNS
jgi:RsiW-degrading membrane proteinase PrsW (M82 family)